MGTSFSLRVLNVTMIVVYHTQGPHTPAKQSAMQGVLICIFTRDHIIPGKMEIIRALILELWLHYGV